MLTFRIDVDYAYPSRAKSFLYTYFRRRSRKGYLVYPKMLADLINQSSEDIKVYWFFNICSPPDNEMLSLLSASRHEIGLHIISNPEKELAILENLSPKAIEYYTVHGTDRLLGQIVWHRSLGQKQAVVPETFKLKSFHANLTYCLDWLCYHASDEYAIKEISKRLKENYVISVHPEWLVRRGRINHRGPYINVLRTLLFPCSTT